MFERRTIWQLICDIDDCQAPGPSGEDREEVEREGEAVGWQVAGDVCTCPACSERGRLPDVPMTAASELPTWLYAADDGVVADVVRIAE